MEQRLGCGRVSYRRLGSGPALVLLHGLLGSGWQWKASAERLARRYTCWVLELPGIGQSEAVSDSSLPGLGRWLEQVIEGLGIDHFSLIGSSWGGAVALQFAADDGEGGSEVGQRLERLVVDAPAHPYWTPSRRQRWLLWPLLMRVALRGARWLSTNELRQILAASYGNPERMPPDAVERYQRLLQRPGMGAALAGYARCWQRDQRRLRAGLARIRVPVLLVWGGRDRVVPVASAPALRAHLRCEWKLLPGLGHLPYEEDAAAFTCAIEAFLAAGES